MKVSMNIDIDGFARSCEATISRVSRGTRVAAQEGGATILQIAKAKCPRYTGTLMNSGTLSVDGNSSNNYAQGFSATVSFGGGDAVNPITGEHPSKYAAAVHEGFAANPLTGELSDYRSGEPKFLEKAIRLFEQSGLHKVAYKHWKQAIYPSEDYEFMYGYAPTGEVNLAKRLVDDAMMDRMGAGWWGETGATREGSRYSVSHGYMRFADTGEMKPNPTILYKARALSERMYGPRNNALDVRPESLYIKGAYDTVGELAEYLNDLAWGGAEFASERASESIRALVGKYEKAGMKLSGNDVLYNAYKNSRKRK